jgi:hypothetical protein
MMGVFFNDIQTSVVVRRLFEPLRKNTSEMSKKDDRFQCRDDMDFESIFEQIKKDYFPTWDCKNEWQLTVGEDLYGAQAICNSASKTITLLKDYFIQPDAPKINQLKVVLIHEISHTTTTTGFHEEEWITQMKQVAEMADELGDIELAQLVREEVDRYVNRKENDRYLLGKARFESI